MSMKRWLASWGGWKLKARRRKGGQAGAGRARLSVEVLEGRLVLSNGVLLGGTLPNLNGVVFTNDQPVGPTVDISQRQGNEWNPAFALDPTHPSHLFSVANWDNQADYQGIGAVGLFAAYSSDGGAHWTSRALAAGGDGLPIATDGDAGLVGASPSVAWDQYGNLFLTYTGRVGQ